MKVHKVIKEILEIKALLVQLKETQGLKVLKERLDPQDSKDQTVV